MGFRPTLIVALIFGLGSVLIAQSIQLTRCSDCTTLPRIVSIPKAKLTDEMKTKQLSGKVVLSISIDETGNVTDVQLVSGSELIAQAAIQSARKAKFIPSHSVGSPHRPIKSNTLITYDFILASSPTKRTRKRHH